MNLSVIICTHNPRAHYLKQVLESLQAQTYSRELWELLLIDNASTVPLEQTVDLSWHPLARVVREEQLGLTPARLRGIQESAGEVLVWVDDDNVLEPDYLEVADRLGRTHPFLGAWGSGTIVPSFDSPPPEWALPYVGYLTLGQRKHADWANFREAGNHVPAGAGMCVRRAVAQEYLDLVRNSEFRKALDRRGTSLVSGGDADMALTGCDMGHGSGVFPELKITHLIPESRLQRAYLLRLAEDMQWSGRALGHLRGHYHPGKGGFLFDLLKKTYYSLRLRGFARDFFLAQFRGDQRAQRDFGEAAQSGRPMQST